MFIDIISKPETQYLGFGLMMPWENNLEIQFNLWKDGFASGKINRLKEICGCIEGYALLEIYTPENPTDGSYNLEMLLPIKRK